MSIEQPQTSHALHYTGPFSENVYRDRINGWRRRFTLDADRLIIQRAKFMGSESESIIPLRRIDPMYEIARHRDQDAVIGGILNLGGALALLGLAIHYQGAAQVLGSASSLLSELWGVLGLLCVIMGLKNIRGIELYAFRHSDGRFDIARNGPDRDHFDAFIARLIARAESLRTVA